MLKQFECPRLWVLELIEKFNSTKRQSATCHTPWGWDKDDVDVYFIPDRILFAGKKKAHQVPYTDIRKVSLSSAYKDKPYDKHITLLLSNGTEFILTIATSDAKNFAWDISELIEQRMERTCVYCHMPVSDTHWESMAT